MPFKSLGLADKLVQGILATGYEAPTEIQSQAIPIGVEGKDIIGIAQTGTGKTAAFVLPILQRLSLYDELGHKGAKITQRVTRALIVTPTRELALQIEESLKNYGRFLRLKSVTVYGGVSMDKQFRALDKGVDVIIATPGRLFDHIQRRTINLSDIEILVLDEADRMFDMGFINDVKRIVALIPKERQTMLFSATMSKEIQQLAAGILTHPKLIQVGKPHNPVESVQQHFYTIAQDQKSSLLHDIITSENLDCVLVFSRTKHGADKITKRLEQQKIKAVAIHSNRSQSQRLRALEGFKRGHYNVLVATDIAARGIDITGISHVINYDTPTFAEDYIHRIGRTGRASATGDALTFVSREEEKYLRSIEKFIGKKFERKKYEGCTNTTHASTQSTERHQPTEELPMQPLSNEHPRLSQHDERFSKKKRTEGQSGQPFTNEHPKEQDSHSSARKKSFQRDRRDGNRDERFGRRERNDGERRDGFGRREQSGDESREGFGQRERKDRFGRRERNSGSRSENSGRQEKRNEFRDGGYERRDRRNDVRFGKQKRNFQDNNFSRDSFSHQPLNEEAQVNFEKKDYRTLFEKKHHHFEKREKLQHPSSSDGNFSSGESAGKQFKKKKKLTISNVQPVHQGYADKMKERKEKDERKKRFGAGSSAFDKFIYLRDNNFKKKKKRY